MPLCHALGRSTSGRLRTSGQDDIYQYKNIGICALRTPERTSGRSALGCLRETMRSSQTSVSHLEGTSLLWFPLMEKTRWFQKSVTVE